jgi:hypothetical protein
MKHINVQALTILMKKALNNMKSIQYVVHTFVNMNINLKV